MRIERELLCTSTLMYDLTSKEQGDGWLCTRKRFNPYIRTLNIRTFQAPPSPSTQPN